MEHESHIHICTYMWYFTNGRFCMKGRLLPGCLCLWQKWTTAMDGLYGHSQFNMKSTFYEFLIHSVEVIWSVRVLWKISEFQLSLPHVPQNINHIIQNCIRYPDERIKIYLAEQKSINKAFHLLKRGWLVRG